MAWQALLLLASLASVQGVNATQIPLHVERVFPESLYRIVHGKCTELWYQLRTAHEQAPMPEKFQDEMVDSLVLIDGQVKILAQEQRHAPDDLEHLLGIVQLMHGEYVYNSVDRSPDPQNFHAVGYFFKRIKQRLEHLLNRSAT